MLFIYWTHYERFSPCHDECIPGLRIHDLWNNRITFHECDRTDDKAIARHVESLTELCARAALDTFQVICATDASVPTTNQWQAVAVAACWVGEFQTASIKVPAGRVTSVDAELFAIRLAIAKATTTGCPDIVVITGCFPAAKRAVNTAIHSGQGHYHNFKTDQIALWDSPRRQSSFLGLPKQCQVVYTCWGPQRSD